MAKDLTVTGWAEDRPGLSAGLGEALGRAGVNIEGIFGSAKLGEIHVLVEDAAAATQAIARIGFRVSDERNVLVLALEDRPGAWGEVARRIADAGANLELHYLATSNRIVVAPDDLEKARAAVS